MPTKGRQKEGGGGPKLEGRDSFFASCECRFHLFSRGERQLLGGRPPAFAVRVDYFDPLGKLYFVIQIETFNRYTPVRPGVGEVRNRFGSCAPQKGDSSIVLPIKL